MNKESEQRKPRGWEGLHRREGWLRSASVIAARLGVPVILLWSVFTFAHTTGATADPVEEAESTSSQPSSTMTFHTGVNLLGVLDSMGVQPQVLSVEPGEVVELRNNSLVSLTLSVRDHTLTVPAQSSTAMRFNGEEEAATIPVSATVLNAPILGDVLGTRAQIKVPAVPDPSSSPAEDTPTSPDGTGTGSTPSEGSDASGQRPAPVVPVTEDAVPDSETEEDSSSLVDENAEETTNGHGGERDSESSAHSDQKKGEKELSAYDETSYRSLAPIDSTAGLLIAAAMVLMVGVGMAGFRVIRHTTVGRY